MLRINVYHEGDVVRVCKQYSGGTNELEMFQLVEGESCNVTVNAPLTCTGHKKVNGKLESMTSEIDVIHTTKPIQSSVDLDVNSPTSVFMQGVKQAPEANPIEVLNWYRNLYYKEASHTERGCLANAINEVLQLIHSKEVNVNAEE